jgi:predicted nucleic acid-binding Zn finger protein
MKKYERTEFDEMSKPLAWIINKVRALEPEINEHALKIMLFEQESTWKKSITNWLVDISTYTVKGSNNFLKKGQYFEYLYSEPFENGKQEYRKTTLYKYCSKILGNDKYKNLKTKYRKIDVPVDKWQEILRQFYIEVDDYLSKGILDYELGTYLVETYISK